MQGRKVEWTIRAKGKINGIGGAELVTWWRKVQKKTYQRARFSKVYMCSGREFRDASFQAKS